MHAWRRSVTAAMTLGLLSGMMAGTAAAQADGQISYSSQPDRLAVFLNNVAYAEDAVSLPGGVDMQVMLPDTVVADTLILREDGARVPDYRLDRSTGRTALQWRSSSDSALREVTLEYLLSGVSWRPRYDMWLGADTDETVELDFYAEIQDGSLTLDDVETQLVAGFVDLTSVIDPAATLSVNQALAGYEDTAAPRPTLPAGQVDIQHVYDIGRVTAEPGDVVYTEIVGGTLPARRLHLWNASTDQQVTVIYKVENDSEQPLAEGVVRTYQGGLFIGSDYIERTPIGSEGSVTVGHLQDVRVLREESQTLINEGRFSYLVEVELTISNFTPETIHLEVVDHRRAEAEEMQFSIAPQQETGNVMRWVTSVKPDDEMVIRYEYKVD